MVFYLFFEACGTGLAFPQGASCRKAHSEAIQAGPGPCDKSLAGVKSDSNTLKKMPKEKLSLLKHFVKMANSYQPLEEMKVKFHIKTLISHITGVLLELLDRLLSGYLVFTLGGRIGSLNSISKNLPQSLSDFPP